MQGSEITCPGKSSAVGTNLGLARFYIHNIWLNRNRTENRADLIWSGKKSGCPTQSLTFLANLVRFFRSWIESDDVDVKSSYDRTRMYRSSPDSQQGRVYVGAVAPKIILVPRENTLICINTTRNSATTFFPFTLWLAIRLFISFHLSRLSLSFTFTIWLQY